MDSVHGTVGLPVAGPTGQAGLVPAERHRLRMLAVLASPVAGPDGDGPPLGPPLDLWGEWERLAEALGARDAADGGAVPWAVGRLPSATAVALADELAQCDGYQVLHLASHGCPEGVVLEDRLGRETLLPTAELAAALRGRGVRLVVLNACETVEVARTLVEQGAVEAALATRESIYDEEAKVLTRRLYRRLAQSEPVATAVAAARDEIQQVAAERLAHLGVGPAARADNLVLVGDGRVRLTVEPPVAESPLLRRGLPPHNDPIPLARLAGFVGRHEELYELMQWFEEPGKLAYALHGVGGIGKTTLALAAAVRQGHRFDALAFASAKERPDFGAREVHHALAGALRLPPDPAAADDPEAAVTRLLNAHRVLIVLDNLETAGADGRRALARIIEGVEPAAGSRVLLTLRPQEADPLTRRVPDRRRLEALDDSSALRLAWELAAARSGFPAPPAAAKPSDAEKARLEQLVARAHLHGLPLGWAAALEALAGLAFRHPKILELATALVEEHGWGQTEVRLGRFAGHDVKEALDRLIGTMINDLAAREPEALILLQAALVFEGGAPLALLREVALGRKVDDEDDAALAFADGPLRAARRANLVAGDGGRFDLDPPVRAFIGRFRPSSVETRHELDLRHAKALLPVLEGVETAFSRGEVSLTAIPEWRNLTLAWERLAASAPTHSPARAVLLQHAAHWHFLVVGTYDPRREYWLAAALAAARTECDQHAEANVNFTTGYLLKFRDVLGDALHHYQHALDGYRAVGDRLGEARTVCAIGDVHFSRKHLDDAFDHYHRALDLSRAAGDRLGEANTLAAIGHALAFRDQDDAALDHYQRALETYLAIRNPLGEARTLRAIGETLEFRDQHEGALDNYYRALQAFRVVGDRLGEANTLLNIGDVRQAQDRYDEAVGFYERALATYRAIGDRLGEANTLLALGDVLQWRWQIDQALDHFRRASEIYAAVGDRLGVANSRTAEGRDALLRGDRAAADSFLAGAVLIYEALGDRWSVASKTGDYGRILLRANRPAEARPFLLRAADLFAAMGLENYAEQHRTAAESKC